MELGRRGADRQEMHETIRENSLKAWAAVQEGKPNPLVELLGQEASILKYMTKEEVLSCLDASDYYGDAPRMAKAIICRNQSHES